MKPNTKENIIEVAISLFNEVGMFKVRNQDIADKAGMSLSNFNYHFATRNDLVLGVIRQMQDDLLQNVFKENLDFLSGEGGGLSAAIDYFNYEKRYCFFYLDTNNIIETYPEVKDKLQYFIEASILFIKKSNQLAIQQGILSPPPSSQPELYDHLAKQVWINNHFLFALAKIRGNDEDLVKKGLRGIYTLYYPYLTKAGKKRFEKFKNVKEVT